MPRREWTLLSHRVIFHGRRVCHARKPACGACGLARWCPSYGAGPTDPEVAAALLDLRPDLAPPALLDRLSAPRRGQSLSNWLRKAAGLPPVALGLLREAAHPVPTAPAALAALIKAVPLRLVGVRPIEQAISSAGGIALDELDAGFMLRRLPGVFAAGEMLDWEAPTGGYLLQAAFSTGRAVGDAVAARYAAEPAW